MELIDGASSRQGYVSPIYIYPIGGGVIPLVVTSFYQPFAVPGTPGVEVELVQTRSASVGEVEGFLIRRNP